MAITTTPLGFQKPDGNEPFRQGNDVISANAQDLLSSTIGRLGAAEASINAGAGGLPSACGLRGQYRAQEHHYRANARSYVT